LQPTKAWVALVAHELEDDPASFLDQQCAYPSVEVTINWNAAAVYLMNARAEELAE